MLSGSPDNTVILVCLEKWGKKKKKQLTKPKARRERGKKGGREGQMDGCVDGETKMNISG